MECFIITFQRRYLRVRMRRVPGERPEWLTQAMGNVTGSEGFCVSLFVFLGVSSRCESDTKHISTDRFRVSLLSVQRSAVLTKAKWGIVFTIHNLPCSKKRF